jgi:peptidoglycan hydrolase CwlO-like protein
MDIRSILLNALASAWESTTTDDVPIENKDSYRQGRDRLHEFAIHALEKEAKFIQARFEDEADTIHRLNTRIAELEARIEVLNGVIESQKQTKDSLIKRITCAMYHMEVINPDTYHLSVVYNILNGGKH